MKKEKLKKSVNNDTKHQMRNKGRKRENIDDRKLWRTMIVNFK